MAGSLRFALTLSVALALPGCGWLAFEDKSTSPESSQTGNDGIPRAEQPANCPTTGAALQVLGSGGPIAEAGRAGTSYLLWIDGEAKLLIDAGSGSFLRFAEAGGKVASLDAILLTHLHADHAGDVIDILNTGGFEGRTEPLTLVGPGEAPRFPATSEFIERLIAKEGGAFAYNGGYGDGTEGKAQLEVRDIPSFAGNGELTPLDVSNDFSVIAYPVDHGPVPALAYEIDVGGKSVVIAGDQSGRSVVFQMMMEDASPAILFAHHVINGEDGQPRGLHRTPAQIGELAGAMKPQRLILTHNMERSLSRIDDSLNAIGQSYSGDVSVAADLDCYAL
ncbi:MBL fold metallo-hydrolase [Erythrobacter crassostreae]|uniref:MBL fold metallo-hydrolase n=1 Tax=Erythrobacter crassostreae TaxID=2828328 RepID=A0A9X1F2D4_9SPHN|nr:MBL fold metallo-hydrolase [Erythrobacter crassostrea]MBV7258842.1 MBL fold metallo-hydrolase [Erythrobacter crassostrea]